MEARKISMPVDWEEAPYGSARMLSGTKPKERRDQGSDEGFGLGWEAQLVFLKNRLNKRDDIT